MSASVASSRSEGGGPTTVSSQNSSASNRVMVEQIFPQQQNYESVCLLPQSDGSLQTSVLRRQSCCSPIYSVDSSQTQYNESSQAELSAFLSEVDPCGNHIVELCCDPTLNKKSKSTKSFFRLEFEDEIRKVQLLPLPLSTNLHRAPSGANPTGTASETVGVLLVVVSKRSGMSVHSLVLTRESSLDLFHVAEFAKVSRGTVEDTGPCTEVSIYLDNTRNEEGRALNDQDSILYVALMPCNPSLRSHRIDILACPLVGHKSPLFRFNTRGPTRALKRSLILTGVGSAKGISISVRRVGSLPFCTLAALFDSEMKIISLPSLPKWSKQALRPKDILTVPFNAQSMGIPSSVVPITGSNTSTNDLPVKFAVLCHPYKPVNRSREPQSPLLSPLAYEPSPSSVKVSSRRPPPQWTATETRNAVLRARRDVMSNVIHTLHGEDGLRKSMGLLQPFDDESSYLQTPKGKGTRSSNDSSVLDENFDITIPSPDTAILDMSGKWMNGSISDSIMSPLRGLGFTGNDDSSLASFRTHETPRNSDIQPHTGEEGQARPAQLVMISISETNKTDDSTNAVTTHVHDLPLEFPSCFEAVSMKETQQALLLAAKSPSSSEVRVLYIPLSRGQLTGDLASLEEMSPVQIKSTQLDWKVNALELESLGERVLLRILTSKNASVGQRPFGPDLLTEHIVNLQATTISTTISEGQEISTPSPPQNDHLVAEKLDMIMSTLLRFESNVNERLTQMENNMMENSKRLARLEENISTRAEI